MSQPITSRQIGAFVRSVLPSEAVIQGNFITSDAIPWKLVDPENHPKLEMFAVWGNPNEGASLILQKFPAGMGSGCH